MLIDLHFHTSKFSSCSRMTLEEGLGRARDLGLGGICVTEHDVFPSYRNLDELSSRFGPGSFHRGGDLHGRGGYSLFRPGSSAASRAQRARADGGGRRSRGRGPSPPTRTATTTGASADLLFESAQADRRGGLQRQYGPRGQRARAPGRPRTRATRYRIRATLTRSTASAYSPPSSSRASARSPS